jgi:hypothetical protein
MRDPPPEQLSLDEETDWHTWFLTLLDPAVNPQIRKAPDPPNSQQQPGQNPDDHRATA